MARERRVLCRPNIRYFADHGVRGLFEEGPGISVGDGSDLVEMKDYVMAEMMWDPSLDPDVLITEFLKGYYSAGAPFIRRYMDTMHDAVLSSGYFLEFACMGPPAGVHKAYLTPDALLDSATAFSEGLATTAIGPDKYSVRLARASMANLYTVLWRWSELQSFAANKSLPWPLPATQEAGFTRFATIFNSSGTKLLTNSGLGPAARSGSGGAALQWLHRCLFEHAVC